VIVVDTSALMAIVLREVGWEACSEAIAKADGAFMSAGTMAEAAVVGGQRGLASELFELIDAAGIVVESVTAADAVRVGEAYSKWGKGVHRAHLNLGDCFAYALAKLRGCPLLFVGKDFTRTDIVSAL
jgi:ribonuclease VapC